MQLTTSTRCISGSRPKRTVPPPTTFSADSRHESRLWRNFRIGVRRDDLAPGLCTLSFERRIVIAYAVRGSVVMVLRVVSGARELGPLFGG